MSADIRSLELEFNKAPSIDTCIPLCEAYLVASRFMEAMVVCKKGIKSAPNDPRGRVMLSRVYLEQGKVPKAQEELNAVAAEHPQDPNVLELQGRLAMLRGDAQTAAQYLMVALQVNPGLTNARMWLTQLGVQMPAAQPAPQQAMPQQAMPAQAMPPARPGQQPMPQQAMPPARPMQPPAQGMPPAIPQQGFPPPMGAPGMQPPPMQAGMVADTFAAGAAAPANFGATPFGATPFDAQPVEEAAPPMEHVSDFFSSNALGFSNDAGGPETAGPGRLTIIGFVPKNSGSIKTTIFVALGVLAVAAVVLSYVWVSSKNKREINDKFSMVLAAMDQDKYVEYQKVIELGKEILAIDDAQPHTLATLAQTHAILAHEHGDEDSLAKAKDYLRRAAEADPEPNEWRVVAAALVAYHEGNYDAGIAGIKDIAEKSSKPSVWMEYFRLLRAKSPGSEETTKALKRTVAAVVGEARVYNFLGWHFYSAEQFNDADKHFSSALQNVKSHEAALIGAALADLDRGLGLEQRQVEIDKNIKKVFALPAEEVSQPIRALAHFARSQLRNWQGKSQEATEDYEKALKLDPKNPLFPYRRGVGELGLGRAKEAAGFLEQALKLQPKRVQFIIKLVEAQLKSGDKSGAEETLKRGLDLDSGNWELLKAQGDLLVAKGDFNGAIEAYKKIDEKAGGRAITEAQVGIAKAYRMNKKAPAASKHLENFLAKAPASVSRDPELQARLWEALGLALEAGGSSAKADEAFNAGIELYRYYAGNFYHRCRLMKFKGPEAKEICKAYVTLDPRGEYVDEVRKKAGIK